MTACVRPTPLRYLPRTCPNTATEIGSVHGAISLRSSSSRNLKAASTKSRNGHASHLFPLTFHLRNLVPKILYLLNSFSFVQVVGFTSSSPVEVWMHFLFPLQLHSQASLVTQFPWPPEAICKKFFTSPLRPKVNKFSKYLRSTSKFYEPQNGDVKQVSYWRPTDIRRYRKKFSRPGVCEPLPQAHEFSWQLSNPLGHVVLVCTVPYYGAETSTIRIIGVYAV